MSDSHDNWDKLNAAIDSAHNEDCSVLLFAGDLIAPPGVEILENFNGSVFFVWGNNEMERVGITRMIDASEKVTLSGDFYEGEFDGIKIFMNHYPKYSELAAKSGEYNLCIHGHTHQLRNETINQALLVNPGEIQAYKTGKSTYMIFDTSNKTVEITEL